jgi:enoyl-CoA hydratase
MGADVVLLEKECGIGIITINRPEVRNALNRMVFHELKRVLSSVRDDEEIRAVIVTGAGEAFVAGADVGEMAGLESISGWIESRVHQSVLDDLERLGKPSIAAINGSALGGGLELAMACTIRVASEKAKVGLPELGLGILPGFGGTQRLMRIVGYAKAAELVLTATIMTAEEGHKIGLVNHVVPHDEVLAKAKKIAQTIAGLSPIAVRLEMELLLHGRDAGIDEGLALESAVACLSLSSKEAKELLSRFLERKK